MQKRLLLCDLPVFHAEFCEKHPTVSVRFSRFAELHPKYCILAGARWTHTICVCMIHQNITFMVHGTHLTGGFNV
jgi:hypothetical protein